jgi:hypothetical protein
MRDWDVLDKIVDRFKLTEDEKFLFFRTLIHFGELQLTKNSHDFVLCLLRQGYVTFPESLKELEGKGLLSFEKGFMSFGLAELEFPLLAQLTCGSKHLLPHVEPADSEEAAWALLDNTLAQDAWDEIILMLISRKCTKADQHNAFILKDADIEEFFQEHKKDEHFIFGVFGRLCDLNKISVVAEVDNKKECVYLIALTD